MSDPPIGAGPLLDPSTRARARSLGAVGQEWLRDLPAAIESRCAEWQLTLHEVLVGGSASWVARVRRADGTDAVLKIALPSPTFGQQVSTLLRARGHGYVVVLAHDEARYAVLLEALGDRHDSRVTTPTSLLRTGGRLLREAWACPRSPDDSEAPATDLKVQGLRALVRDELARVDHAPPPEVLRHALLLLGSRAAAWDPERAVVVHGDPHVGNMLPVMYPREGAVDGQVFIDPDGFLADPAYDLGVLVREWNEALLAEADPAAILRGWCTMLADETGVDADAVWEWGYIERVTTGLHLLGMGLTAHGRDFLEVARRLL